MREFELPEAELANVPGRDRASHNLEHRPEQNPKRRKSYFRGMFGLVSGLAVLAGFCLVVFLTVGFVRFTYLINDDVLKAAVDKADGIVVLTGGKARIETAISLLQEKKATRLLITGVYPKTSKQVIAKIAKTDADLLDCCVDIDHLALDTKGNANQAANWAKTNGFSNIVVVTSNYHMPRAMLEMRSAMAGVALTPHAVSYRPLSAPRWYSRPAALKLVVSEYAKYIAASFRNDLDRVDRKLTAYAGAYSK